MLKLDDVQERVPDTIGADKYGVVEFGYKARVVFVKMRPCDHVS